MLNLGCQPKNPNINVYQMLNLGFWTLSHATFYFFLISAEHQTDTQEGEEKEYIDFLWKQLPETTKRDYGKEYLDQYLTVQSFSSIQEPTEVLNDLEDAVMSKCPQFAYTSGFAPKLGLILERCFPQCWRRCPLIMRQLTFHFEATPAALRTRWD